MFLLLFCSTIQIYDAFLWGPLEPLDQRPRARGTRARAPPRLQPPSSGSCGARAPARAGARCRLIQCVRARSRALAPSPLRALARSRARGRSRARARSRLWHPHHVTRHSNPCAANNLRATTQPNNSFTPLPPPPPPPPTTSHKVLNTRVHSGRKSGRTQLASMLKRVPFFY